MTPNYPRVSLDEVFSDLMLAGTQVPSGLPKKVLLWGERVSGISSYLAGWMAGRGFDVIVLDGANGFDPYMASSFARKAFIPPERLLKRIRIARAFTCYQMATLVERLAFLLHSKGVIQPEFLPSPFRRLCRKSVYGSTGSPRTDHGTLKINYLAVRPEPFDPPFVLSLSKDERWTQDRRVEGRTVNCDTVSRRGRDRVGVDQDGSSIRNPCVILLGLMTTFLDEDVPEREVGPLFERSLRKMEVMAGEGIPFFLFQPYTNPLFLPFTKRGRRRPEPDDGAGRVGGSAGSRRTDLMRRLFQFSNRVWKISLEEQGPKLVLEKGLTVNRKGIKFQAPFNNIGQ
ncbi:MAG: hypothetical protein A2156_14460 [Deltaproteobacteria bacterium RBG_16_48_10]|nr:MAG: hypothetical protein A2156_14460 [Deltaproteobacteria bacterium RBG_16_48_10]